MIDVEPMRNRSDKLDNKEDAVNKSVLLNYLNSVGVEVSLKQLGEWIKARTGGRYILVKKEEGADIAPVTEI